MIQDLGKRLRVVLDRPAPPADGHTGSSPARRGTPAETEPPASSPPEGLEVEFVAYGEDCVLTGQVRLGAERVTDLLNAHEEYLLADVLVESIVSGEVVEVSEVVVPRDEILLVHATGPRGSQRQRTRTRLHRVAMQVGPYHVRGYLHAKPGIDPILTVRSGRPMVPLTEASIEFGSGDDAQLHRARSLVVNRDRIEWVVPASDDDVDLPELPVKPAQGRLVKDFTGTMFAEPESETS